jgi:hypothetical protein
MREYRPRTVQELAACTCDRCQRRLTPNEPGEWQERLSIDQSCGFDSVFGDGNTIGLDLCQHCVREVLGQWLRITSPSEWEAAIGRVKETTELASRAIDATLADVEASNQRIAAMGTRPPRKPDVLHGSAVRYDAPTEPVDVEWKAGKGRRKGIVRKPEKPVSIEDMNAAIAEQAGLAGDAKLPRKRKPQKRQ